MNFGRQMTAYFLVARGKLPPKILHRKFACILKGRVYLGDFRKKGQYVSGD